MLLNKYNRTTPPLDFGWTIKFEKLVTDKFFASRIKEVYRNGDVVIDFNVHLQSEGIEIKNINEKVFNLSLQLS